MGGSSVNSILKARLHSDITLDNISPFVPLIGRYNEGKVKSDSLTSHLSKQNKTCYRLKVIGGLTTRPDLVVLKSSVGVLLSGDPYCGNDKDDGVVSFL